MISRFIANHLLFYCAVKVLVGLSDETNGFPPGSPAASQPLLPLMPSPATLKQRSGGNTSNLSMLLDALDENLTEQGVIVKPQGCCELCAKPVIGPVSIVVHSLLLLFLSTTCTELWALKLNSV